MIFLHAIFPVTGSDGLLIICTAETHRKYSHHRNVLLTFYIKKTVKSTIFFEAVLLSANIIQGEAETIRRFKFSAMPTSL